MHTYAFSQQTITDTVSTKDSVRTSNYASVFNPAGPLYQYGLNFTKMIEGRIPGLQSTNGGGQPGSSADLMLRGYSTLDVIPSLNTGLADNKPLIVLDGFIYTGDIASIDPRDIDVVSVLKDAGTLFEYAAYGNANGVIVITTKRGHEKKKLQVDARAGIITAALQDYNTMNPQQFYETSFDAIRNAALSQGFTPSEAARYAADNLIPILAYNAYNVPDNQLIDPNTGKVSSGASLIHHDDWKKEARRVGLHHSYNLSFENRDDKTDYRLSSGYAKEQGYMLNTGYERFNIRLDGNHKFRPWLQAGINTSGALSAQQQLTGGGATGYSNPVMVSQMMAPIYPVYYRGADGEKEIDPVTGDYRYSFDKRAFGSGTNALAIQRYSQNVFHTTSFTLRPYVSLNFLKHFSFTSFFNLGYFRTGHDVSSLKNYLPLTNFNTVDQTSWGLNYQFRQELSWSKKIKEHSFSMKAVVENQRNEVYDKYDEFSGDGSHVLSYRNQNGVKAMVVQGVGEYNFKERYFVSGGIGHNDINSGTLPYDLSSVNYYANLAWVLSNENFLKEQSLIDLLKIKASYGNVLKKTSFFYNNDIYSSMSFGNQSRQLFSIAMDFALLRGRVRGDIAFYNRNTPASTFIKLSTNPLPIPLTGFELNNKGVEASVGISLIRKYTISWDININVAHYRTTMAKMPEGIDSFYYGIGVAYKGASFPNFFLPESAGVDPATGKERWYYTDAAGQRIKTSDFHLAQDVYSMVNAGSVSPILFGGVQNTISAGRFSFFINLTFGLGGKVYDNVYASLMDTRDLGHSYAADLLDRWTPDNKNATIPKAEYGAVSIASTRFLKSASCLNIRSVSAGYDAIEEKSRSNKTLKSLRVYISGDNLWLFAAGKGLNPQGSFNGISGFVYGPARAILLGVSVGL